MRVPFCDFAPLETSFHMESPRLGKHCIRGKWIGILKKDHSGSVPQELAHFTARHGTAEKILHYAGRRDGDMSVRKMLHFH